MAAPCHLLKSLLDLELTNADFFSLSAQDVYGGMLLLVSLTVNAVGSHHDALESYQKAVALAPSRLIHRVELGRTLHRLGKKEQARQELEVTICYNSFCCIPASILCQKASSLSGSAIWWAGAHHYKCCYMAHQVVHRNSFVQHTFDVQIVVVITLRPTLFEPCCRLHMFDSWLCAGGFTAGY